MTTANGTSSARVARRSLSEQIDRLDGILDGLAEALNESVADAVRDVIGLAVREAVSAAVTEVLSSPRLLQAALERHAPPEATPAPKPPTVRENLARVGNRLGEKVKQAAGLLREKLGGACTIACAAGKRVGKVAAVAPVVLGALARKAWAFRMPCAIALGAGVVCGAACYLGGPLMSAAANGLGGATVALSALTLPLKRLFTGGKAADA